jgi:hypothetical protein
MDKPVKPKLSRKSVSTQYEDLINVEDLDTEILSHPQVLDVGSASSEESDEGRSSCRGDVQRILSGIQGRHIYNGNYRAMAKQMMSRISYVLE